MPILPQGTKDVVFAVKIAYHTSEIRYVLGTAQTVSIGGDSYTPLPGADIEFGNYSITLNERAFTLILPLVPNDFSDQVSSGYPFAPVTVEIYEVANSLNTADEETFQLFAGEVVEAYRNYRGRRGLVGLKCVTCKARLGSALGIPVNAQCPWIFTSSACGVLPAPDSAQITSLVGRALTVTWLTGPILTPEYYFRGYVEFESLKISIRAWGDGDPTEIGLVKEAPPSWIGATVQVFPGCDKTIEVCRTRWNNEARFGGSGFKMPAYKPIFETPS